MAKDTKPHVVQGGCLCGSVRYTITFPPDHDFASSVSTCQCGQCRKNTGSLVFTGHTVPTSAVAFNSDSTLKRFYATPGIARGFCSACGGFLFWHNESSDGISIAVGALDASVLREHGEAVAVAGTHLWMSNAIRGATDDLKGELWVHDNVGEGARLMQ